MLTSTELGINVKRCVCECECVCVWVCMCVCVSDGVIELTVLNGAETRSMGSVKRVGG